MKNEPEQTVPHCPECKTDVLLVEIADVSKNGCCYDWQCPKCHKKFELLKMGIKRDKHSNVKRYYKLRGETKIKYLESEQRARFSCVPRAYSFFKDTSEAARTTQAERALDGTSAF